MKGETANITHLCEFGWYDRVYFRDNAVTYPNDRWVLGRWLGPSTDIGPALCAKILNKNGRCVYRSSYRHLTEDDQNSPEEKKKRESYDQMIHSKLGSPASTQEFEEDYSTPEYELCEDDDGDGVPHAKECKDEPTPLTYDTYIRAEVVLPKGNVVVFGTVKSRVKDFEGQCIRKAVKNPILDTRVYNVEFSDGEVAELSANIIAECMYAQCDIEGNQYRLMDHIVDHRKDNKAVSKDNQDVRWNGKTYKQKTTRGWQLCMDWKDKSTSWERLSDMKESYSVEVAEYTEGKGISDEPAFSWWTTHVL